MTAAELHPKLAAGQIVQTGAPASPSAASSSAAALARLAASRARLRSVFERAPAVAPVKSEGGSGMAALWRQIAAARAQTSGNPWLTGLYRPVLEQWRQSPWSGPLQLAADEARPYLARALRRHPLRTLALAAAAGALVAWGRPWRRPVLAGALQSVPLSAAAWVKYQLRQPQVQALLASSILGLLAKTHQNNASNEAPIASEASGLEKTPAGGDGDGDGASKGISGG